MLSNRLKNGFKNGLFIVLLLGLTPYGFASTPSQVLIQGTVINEAQQPLANAKVAILTHNALTDARGRFQLSVPRSNTYSIAINNQDYYSTYQTFSHNELATQHTKTLTAPAIALVEKKPQRVLLAFAGDVMMGRRYYAPHFNDAVLINPDNKLADSKKLLRHIAPYMQLPDYSMVNLETQIARQTPPTKAKKSVTFYSQPDTLNALQSAGIDYVSLGNNHTYDYLESGLASTLKHLNASGLAYSGAGINHQQAQKPYLANINNQPFSLLGYVGWEGSNTPSQVATHSHGGAAYGNLSNIVAGVKNAADNSTVVVQYHGSQEYAPEPTGVTELRLKSALDAGAALAVAHHPHVTQGLELYNNKLIAYSMGNFVFDQNFSSTQHSFILYVWLDNGKFHRAEVIPLYIKAYQPTPALGAHRKQVLTRLHWLSAKRNTILTPNGGHAVITVANSANTLKSKQIQPSTLTITKQGSAKAYPLTDLPWHKHIATEQTLPQGLTYRLGKNLINNSDFENFNTFNISERGWELNPNTTAINSTNNNHYLNLALAANKAQWVGMKYFRRVYKASNPMTIKLSVNTPKNATVKLYWQGRKTRQKLFDAFKNSPKHLLGEVQLSANNQWQNIELNFNSPRIGYKSYRILAQVQSAQNTQLAIDNFALIEWQTSFAKQHNLPVNAHANHTASFIGFNHPLKNDVTLALH